MPVDINGDYTLPTPAYPVVAGTLAKAADVNSIVADIAAALNQVVLRTGVKSMSADLPMASHKLTGLSAGSSNGDSVRYEQLTALSTAIYAALAAVSGAALIGNTAAGSIAATTVQAALNELDTEKAPLNSPALTGTPTAPTAANGTNTTQVATTAFALANGLPTGSIIDFAGTAAPTGFLACPITATNISRTTYATLFAAIGTTWGAGDGSTTFGQPYFPADYVAGQANANVGSTTTGANLAHTHAMNADGANVAKRFGADGPIDGSSSTSSAEDAHYNGSQNTGSSGGSANLAASMRVLKCVKYV